MPDALPYETPAEDSVRAGAWTTELDHRTVPLPEWLPLWDISQELHAVRRLEIDLDRVYADTGIPSAYRLGISVLFTSAYEDEAFSMILDTTTDTVSTDVTVDLHGSVLGSSVILTTALILKDETPQTDAPVAWRRGSILWSDQKKVRLYGDSSQFPVTEIDFADCGLDPGAPWALEIGNDLELPAMGAILLLVNNRFPLVTAAARSADPDRPELAVVRSQLFADIARTLVEYALAQNDIGRSWPEDSLGLVLATLLSSRFQEPVGDLRNLRDQDPAAWAAKLASTFGLLREPLP